MGKINQGLLGQIKDSTLKIYEDLTVEKIEKFIDEISHTKEEKSDLPPYGYVGGGLYHIGNGAYCNKKGFDQFEKELIAQLNTYTLKWPPKVGLKRLSNIEIRRMKNDKFN